MFLEEINGFDFPQVGKLRFDPVQAKKPVIR